MEREPSDSTMVQMSDGVRLATDIYLPEGPGPFPAVLIRHPYPPCEWPSIAGYIADRGYAAVIQIVRGKNRSEGDPIPFVHDRQDANDTLDWIEESTWSDGKVATFGDSYFGFTQWAAAASGHRALRALATRMTSANVARDWMYQGDVFNLGPMSYWAAYTWGDHELVDIVPDWDVRPLDAAIPAWLSGRRCVAFDEWREHGPDDPFWTTGIYGQAQLPTQGLGVPTLHRGAWWDPFRRGQVEDWQTAARTSPHEQRLVIDATDHYDHPWAPDETVVDMMQDYETFSKYLPHYLDEALDFFDRHLKGSENGDGAGDPVRYRLANADWRTAATWPPPDAQELNLHLTSGALAERRDTDRSELSWTHDPENLVPSPTNYWDSTLEIPDERALADRADVLTFDADEAGAPLDLTGPASAELSVSTTAQSLTVVAQLFDVFPDGRVLRLTEGARRVPANGDGPAPVSIDLGPLGYRVQPGHRLRLHVSSSSFPRFMPDPGDDGDPWTTDRWHSSEQRLSAGGDTGSRLVLTRT